MFRRDILKKNNLYYDELLPCAQDYAFWVQWLDYTKSANINEVLLNHRIHPESIGTKHATSQQAIASKIRCLQIKKIGVTPAKKELILHNDISMKNFQCSREFVLSSDIWLTKLYNSNKITSWLPEPAFAQILSERWYRICRNAQKLGFWTWKTFRQSELSNFITLRPTNKMGFRVKCLLHI